MVHYNTPKHRRKANEDNNHYRWKPCNIEFANISNLHRHQKSVRHKRNVTDMDEKYDIQSSPELD